MEKKFNNARQKYENVKIPKELDNMVNKTIKGASKIRNKKSTKRKIISTVATLVIAVSSITIGLNTSEVFAQTLGEIPILGDIAKLLTFVEYEIHSDAIEAEVSIPEIDGLGDKELEQRINNEIYKKMKLCIEEAEKRANEYKKAYLATGGKEENFHPMIVKEDYELKSINKDILSFGIYHFEALASSYIKTYYYNIDINNNRIITLEDMLGENHIDVVNKSIFAQIEEARKNPNNMFFEGEMGFNGVSENQKFYINEEGNVVIVFDKYEIGPGVMGEPEFVID
ncbi:DUF3298 and DUF4163 domain-containing protein [Sporosalibacterium faouarense]|uniref:DUF3298 and DUF4163 domain-containing protein n=1 Tax=Sporosalibacterium faouarense TaxID=516123 RepID=UPI00192BDEB4|nr:DUF3298 and DUF4163 domain-containing protein [Sporosalibacterium faouarense]